MRLLAHRGFWTAGYEPNSIDAISAAAKYGYGVETDIRDRSGEVVVSHDMPSEAAPTLRELLGTMDKDPRPLALNVKADGLAEATAALLSEFTVREAFVFDMSIPDQLAWLRAGVPALTRWSDVEPTPVLADQSSGVWLDSMHADLWWSPRDVERLVESGRVVAFVSSELHGRAHEPLWQHIRNQRWAEHNNVLLCTDFPDAAEEFFK